MVDYSFLRLKESITDALNTGDSPVSTHIYNSCIQLLPDRQYLQLTNVNGGVALGSNFECFVVDCQNNILADVTDNIFLEEFTDLQGQTQLAIEIINLSVDFYNTTVLLRFDKLASDYQLWTNPINITAYQQEQTSYFEYKNYNDYLGIPYTASQKFQSISVRTYFDIPIDESETQDYYQVSNGNTISARALIKEFERYQLDYIDTFTFRRLNALLKHDLIYLDEIRVTNKTSVPSEDREGDSNWFTTNFTVAKNYNESRVYSPQIYEGLLLVSCFPEGIYVSGTTFTEATFTFSQPITLNSGTISFYQSNGTLIQTFTQADMSVTGAVLTIDLVGTSVEALGDGLYYINISPNLVSAFGIGFVGVLDDTTCTFELIAADYSGDDYSNDYFVNAPSPPNPIIDNLVLFYKFNETSGTTTVDSSVQGINGTVVNAVIDQAGLIDKCYEFNNGATNQYVQVPDNDVLSFGDGAFSIEIWVNPNANFGRIFNKYNATTGDLEWRLFLQSGVLQFFIYTDASNRIGIADNAGLTIGAWHQIVVTYDGSGLASGMKMKVDNTVASFAPQLTGTYTGMPNTAQPVIIGQQADDLTGSNRYSGLIDILREWKGYALSDAEITTLYNGGLGTETI